MKWVRSVLSICILLLVCYLSQLGNRVTSPSLPLPSATPPLTGITKKEPVATKKPYSLYQSGNLHFVFYNRGTTLKVFTYKGEQIYRCRCKNDTFGLGFLHWGACPRGTFRLGRTVYVNGPAFGKYFIPLYDLESTGPMHKFKRTGIGIHGGGSRLANPFKAYQTLLKTHGCLRVSNYDLEVLVRLIHNSRAKGRVSYITVK